METNTEQQAQAKCVECGQTFSVNDMIRHGNVHICATCKPIFLQKLSEGAEIRSSVRYAGFWLRLAAAFLDSIIVGTVNFGIQMLIIGYSVSVANGAQPSLLPLLISYATSFTLGCCYQGFMVGKYGATVGKMACKIKVVRADATPVSFGLAFGRYFAKLVSVLTLLIGYIIAAFDSEKRALHDRICNTRVVVVS
jgi:uncharacterized RDD family membrane protein YckC